MDNIIFAAISPHPPIILPSVGSERNRKQVKSTIAALTGLGKELKKLKPDLIIISSPHPDWGFQVPLYFLAKDFQGKIEQVLIGLESPENYFKKGAKFLSSNFQFPGKSQTPNLKVALIASGDLSHRLKKDGPYGIHPDGPKFDKELIESLRKKDIEDILKLDEKYPEAGNCGLSSFCFILGILESTKVDYQPKILSYECPFGVGYLTAKFKIRR